MYFDDIFKVFLRGTLYEHALNFPRTTDVIRVGLKICNFYNTSNDLPKAGSLRCQKTVINFLSHEKCVAIWARNYCARIDILKFVQLTFF